ncbi:MAG: hypothetical protein ACREPA_02395, partial [Candidatus Dormibacteraceae bacterium]
LPGFTGVNGLDRSRHFGYRGSRSSEVIDHVESPASAVETWVDSVYHRFPVLDREATGAGFGTASVGGLSVEVMELGLGAPAPGAPIVYPRSGQSGVPPQFVGNELPDPAPGARYPIGYPITIQAGGADTLSVTSASLRDAAGHSLPVFTDSPGPANPDLQPGQWAMLAKRPLTPGARYTADAAGSLDGRPFHERWSFTVLAG